MSFDHETALKIAEYRRKSADGTITLEEMRAAVALMRQGRLAAKTASAAKRERTAATRAPVDSDALLSELDAL